MQTFIKIHPSDNVIVALQDIPAGTVLNLSDTFSPKIEANDHISSVDITPDTQPLKLTVLSDIPSGHKISLCNILPGEQIIKYGSPIGYAKENISCGEWVHIHNLKTGLGDLLDYTYTPVFRDAATDTLTTAITDSYLSQTYQATVLPNNLFHLPSTFMGFKRENGKVGVRNEIWVIPTVGCVNNVAASIARQANQLIKGSVDEVIAFPHPYGCSQMGDDQENSRKILADLINHPNAGGVLVLGLGCENSGIDVLKSYIGDYDEKRVKFLVSQECEDEIQTSLELIKELIEYTGSMEREPVSVDKLIIGMKCGGSDGLSGITANPLVGRFSDMLISKGGTTILTEVPEMFGAETILMNRCANEELFRQTVDLINDFKNYFKNHNQTIYENPSPGNKKGGISTLEDKSLGCTQKSGSALVRGVLAYGEPVKVSGLNLLSAPGNDLVASTALAASGAHIVLFTTGRGTPFASPVPTLKIATNSALATKKNNWIDFNAGVLVENASMDDVAKDFYRYIIKVASGEKVCSEIAGFHDMAIFKQGVTL